MPLGAFISSKQIMNSLIHNPVLGHITTFGGHPVSCAAGIAALEILAGSNLIKSVQKKEQLFASLLIHKKIKDLRSKGLLIALEFETETENKKIISPLLQKNALFLILSIYLKIIILTI